MARLQSHHLTQDPTTRRRQAIGNVMVALILLLGLPLLAGADVSLPALISDNMVIQSGAEVPIWGTSEPGEEVVVVLGDERMATTGDSEGKWMVKLSPLEAGGPFEITVTGNNTVILNNVLVGEVWICSGQSNMQWSVSRSANAAEEVAESGYPMVRLFTAKRVVADQPLPDTEGSWVSCGPDTVGSFSAAGYFFGRELRKELNVPVGLIHSSWGGTPAEAWTSLEKLESNPELKSVLDRWEGILEGYPQAKLKYEQALDQWKQEAEKAKEGGKPVPGKPRAPLGPGHSHTPGGLYNGMIATLIPYAIKGAIWYQGESNAGRAHQYRTLFPAMIGNWRSSWGQGDFPFLFVQLANYRAAQPLPSDSPWAELREAQLMALSLPNTGMAVTIDIGEAEDIHPKNKQDVGRRLALWALANTYGLDVVYSGPIYESMAVEGGRARLRFKHSNGGLLAKDNEQLRGFAIAGQDRKFRWAEAKIDADAVVVWSDEVPQPVAVRYAWADNPACNLYNEAGLPASPFRTDNWPGVTVGK